MFRHALFIISIAVLPSTARPQRGPGEGKIPNLPKAVTSFGAVVSDGFLYVYGGHIGKAHAHSSQNLADAFWRLDLARPQAWESLPTRDKVQGLALVAWQGSIIRLGGVTAHNLPDSPSDMHSTATVERYEPATQIWSPLTPLPEPRSSFDAVVLDHHVYVIGGWALSGANSTAVWADKSYVADLRQTPLVWAALPTATFRQRALTVATTSRRIYAIGGLTPDGESTTAVQIYDPATRAWSHGPDLPVTSDIKAFGAAACGVKDTIWASSFDGRILALDEGATEWRDSRIAVTKPRFFHRIVQSPKKSLLFLAGAIKGTHTADVESFDLSLLNGGPLSSLPITRATPQQPTAGQRDWSGFRGDGTSQSNARDLPQNWADDQGIRWSAPLPGYGQSSPVIWDENVYVTAAEGESKDTLHILCFDRASGQPKWRRTCPASQPWKVSDYVSKAAPTPCVDAHGVISFFESGDLIAHAHDGALRWQRSLVKDYGDFKGNHGVGTSPTQDHDRVYLAIDHDGPSYLLALDKTTGRTIWKTEHAQRVSWSSPLLAGGRLYVSASGFVEAYEAGTGKLLWSLPGFSGNNVPSPTLAGERIIVGSTDREQNAAVTNDGQLAWRAAESTSSFASPVVTGSSVFFVNKAGVAFCHDHFSGALRWSLRLPESCWATPIVVGDLVYFFTKGGTTILLRDSPSGPERVAENKLTGIGRIYGVAAVDGLLILRTDDRLVALGAADAPASR